jgi:hypothetical protein
MSHFVIHGYTVMEVWWVKMLFQDSDRPSPAPTAEVYLDVERPPWAEITGAELAVVLDCLAHHLSSREELNPPDRTAADSDTPS